MKIIITGGTGLIGKALANSLAQDDHEVIVLSRSPRLAEGLHSQVRVEGWDARSAKGWGPLADGADAIVNLAGASIAGEGFLPDRWTDERKRLILESRLNAGKAVMEAIEGAAHKPRVLVQASGVDYYPASASGDVTEDTPPGSGFLADVSQQWEASTQAAEALGVRRIIIRTGIVLSTEGGALPRLAFPFKLFAGGPLGSGRQQMPWIHIDDQVGAIRFLIRNSQASGPFNLCAPNPVTNAEFSRELGAAMGRPSLVPVPGFAFEIMFGEVADLLLKGRRAVPARLLELGYEFRYSHVADALKALYSDNREIAVSGH